MSPRSATSSNAASRTGRQAKSTSKGEPPTPARAPVLPAGGAPWVLDALALAPALIVAAAIYAPALRLFFAQDDIAFLSRAAGLAPTPWSFARPLSEGWAWRALHAAFGLKPLPYHAVRLTLHLLATSWVYASGRRLLGGRLAAACAAVLFGASSIAFTPIHWSSCIVEVLAATLALASFWIWLEARERGSTPLLWISALIGIAAALSKESASLLPLALAIAVCRDGSRPRRWGLLVPHATLTAILAIAFLATRSMFSYSQFTGGEAYAMDLSPRFLLVNLATYLSWCISFAQPIRDAQAVAQPSALWSGVVVIGLAVAGVWMERRSSTHAFEVGIGWFAIFLLPVLSLAHHTYLYYLYLPWAGASWAIAAAGQRLARRLPPRTAAAAAVILATLFVAIEARSVRARERAAVRGLPSDKTVRESLLLGNAIAGLRAAHLEPGARVGFVNPFPREHIAAGGARSSDDARSATLSYLPLEAALRGGDALRLFVPGVHSLGFAELPPPAWDDAELFLFNNDGTLKQLGRGAPALAQLAAMALELGRPSDAESLLRRAVALGDRSSDTAFNLMIAVGIQGREDQALRAAREFLTRWPNDHRSEMLRARLAQRDSTDRGARR